MISAILLLASHYGNPLQSPSPLHSMSETWAATDALGRRLPDFDQVGPPRPDRFVGIFYFLWHDAPASSAPRDNTQILSQDPEALSHPESPLWGPVGTPHYWGRPQLGYYRSDDEYVLRWHARMLAEAGVDVVIFDASNGPTYKSAYTKLLDTFAKAQSQGSPTPRVAFLCPFAEPARVVRTLAKDLYGPGLHRNLWFTWKGKPLILADPSRLGEHNPDGQQKNPVRLDPDATLGQSFEVTEPFTSLGVNVTTYGRPEAGFELTLRRDSEHGSLAAHQKFAGVGEYSWQYLRFRHALPPGRYLLQMSRPIGQVGWFTDIGPPFFHGAAYRDGLVVTGTRSLDIDTQIIPGKRLEDFFTFRSPQADYFRGPTAPDMWSWLEAFPQHVFSSSSGTKEQMSVGVAQNAVGGRLGAMSEPGAQGRSWHNGSEDTSPAAVNQGYNFAEQFERAIQEDPEFIFITGWNEWTAGRFQAFPNVHQPVIFVDEFDQEHSRDIEPMLGGHGDDYYYQMAAFIRRYKGVMRPPSPSAARSIDVNGSFSQWTTVRPEFRTYGVDASPGDDPVSMKVARDREWIYFYARSAVPIAPWTGGSPMTLLIRTMTTGTPAWNGYQFAVNRLPASDTSAILEQSLGGWNWRFVDRVRYRIDGSQVELAIRRDDLGLPDTGKPMQFEFKWVGALGDPTNLLNFANGQHTAPDGRFNYLYTAPGR